jgi:hypothetical protein
VQRKPSDLDRLWALARAGHTAAQARLEWLYGPALRRYARRRLRPGAIGQRPLAPNGQCADGESCVPSRDPLRTCRPHDETFVRGADTLLVAAPPR